MHNFMIFYAPLLVVVIAAIISFVVSAKSTKYEDI